MISLKREINKVSVIFSQLTVWRQFQGHSARRGNSNRAHRVEETDWSSERPMGFEIVQESTGDEGVGQRV